jgi:hypothetical protein
VHRYVRMYIQVYMHVCMYVCMYGGMNDEYVLSIHLVFRDLDDIHGGHGQASAVHHAPDVAGQTDVIQVVLRCLHLQECMYVCMFVCMHA